MPGFPPGTRRSAGCLTANSNPSPGCCPAPRPKGAPAWDEEGAEFTKINADKVRNRLIQRENHIYLDGYRDAQAGKPPRDPVPNFRSVVGWSHRLRSDQHCPEKGPLIRRCAPTSPPRER